MTNAIPIGAFAEPIVLENAEVVDAIVDYVPAMDRNGTGQLEPESWWFTFDEQDTGILPDGALLWRANGVGYVTHGHLSGGGLVTFICTRRR